MGDSLRSSTDTNTDMAVFQHCSVLFELKGLPFKDKKKIKFAVTDNGGTMAFVPNKQCTVVVTSGVSSLSPSRLRNIVKYQIPVVGLDYVHRCLEANCQLPVEDFKLDISSSANSPPDANKDKWTRDMNTYKTPKSLDKPLTSGNVSPRDESPKGRGSVIKKNIILFRIYNETDHDLPKFPENFQVAKYSVFQKPNSHSWCLLELQSAKSESVRQYRVVRYWKDDIQSKKAAVRDKMLFVSTSEKAVKGYQELIDSMKAEGLKQQRAVPPEVDEMGSAPLQQLLLEEKLNTGALSLEVGVFVELLWREALGCIDLILSTPVHKISLNDVTRAEGLLLQTQRKLTEHNMEEALSLWSDYCILLPPRKPVIPNMSSVSKQFDLCQVIRDILNVSEMTLGSAVPSSVGKYRALRCGIEGVPPESSEFEAVTSLLRNSKIQVHQILRVNRAPELQNFKSELGNVRPLLHSSSPHNFVGILSRGLLMPHVVVDQHGIQRTDAGNLGSGIYFSDDIKTSLKYSQCSSTDGSRLMLVCDVALGRCKDLLKKDLTLTQAPGGHDSVHGVQDKPGLQSEFSDDEYVVYSADQVKLKYVVQFSMEGDKLKNFTPEMVMSEEQSLPSPNQGVDAGEDGIDDIKNPLENVTAGLLNSSGQQIPLQSVHVKCKLMDLLAQVIIFQKYTNESSVPIEAKYVFPLDDSAAVSGFEAFINGKHVVGQVKEKETARREYKQAIEKGHGAYLMDQDAPDVFTISVGNLPPGATVLIKVTFVSELIIKDGGIFFSLPSSVAPWQESAALNQTTQVTVEKVCVTDEGASTREFNLDMSIEMPHEITEVKCITHKVKMKKTDCKAVVSVLPGEGMGAEGFQLLVTLTEVHVPRMWVEKHPSKDSQACMLVFYPKFEAPSCTTSDEVVLLLDASQSMKGESLNTARTLALQILKTLDQNFCLNVIVFGTDHTESFLSARPIDEARQEAKNFIKNFSSAGGSTELWRPLRALSLLPPSNGTRNLLLLSDGHIQNPELTLQLIRENGTHSRLFTFGLSPTANRHMLRALAQAGGGAYEFFDPKSKHTWSEKVASQVKRMLAPGARSVSVKWQQFNPTAPPPVQAPKQLHALFNDCHTLVFGFVPHCTQATLLGDLSGKEIKTMVSTSELQKTKGTFLHKLTARAIIRDFEDGSLDPNAVLHEEKKAELKSFVIELSKEFSILSQFTSFVAIEERDSGEETGSTDIPKLIAEEDVDLLPYMSWVVEEEENKNADVEFDLSSTDEDDEDYEQYDDIVCTGLLDYKMDDSEPENLMMSRLPCRSESVDYGAEIFDLMEMEICSDDIPQPENSICEKIVMPETISFDSLATRARMFHADKLQSADMHLSTYFPLKKRSERVLEACTSRTSVQQSLHMQLEEKGFAFGQPSPPPPAPVSNPPIITFDAYFSSESSEQHPPAPDPPCIILDTSTYAAQSSSTMSRSFGFGQPPPPPPAAVQNTTITTFDTSGAPPPHAGLFGSAGPRTGGGASMSRSFGFGQPPPPPPAPVPIPPIITFDTSPSRHAALPSYESSLSMSRRFAFGQPPPPPPAAVQNTAITTFDTSGAPPPLRHDGYSGHLRSAGPRTGVGASMPSSFGFGQPPPPAPVPKTSIRSFDAPGAPPPPLPLLGSARKMRRTGASVLDQLLRTPPSYGQSPPPPPPDTVLKPSSCGAPAALARRHPAFSSSLNVSRPVSKALYFKPSSFVPPHADSESAPGLKMMDIFAAEDRSAPDWIPSPQPDSFESIKEVDRSIKFELQAMKKRRRPVLKNKIRASSADGIYSDDHEVPPYSNSSYSITGISKWQQIFSLQHAEGYWELTPQLGQLLNCDITRFADDFLKRKGIASLGLKAHVDILKLLATLLVLQLMRLENIKEGQMLRTLFCLEDSTSRPDHWEAVSKAVKWVCWADREYPCVYSRLEFGLSWDSSTKQLLGAERIQLCSPLTGLNLNPNPYQGPIMQC